MWIVLDMEWLDWCYGLVIELELCDVIELILFLLVSGLCNLFEEILSEDFSVDVWVYLLVMIIL